MAKRRLKKVPKKHDPTKSLRAALMKSTKEELADALVELAGENTALFRRLAAQFKVEPEADELVEATRRAIADATDFDEREINHNFNYDYAAYDEINRSFSRLIDAGQFAIVMELSLELMKQGSYQVEMSDEGLMSSDIEECFEPVVKALGKGALPPTDIVVWCAAMLKSDRVEFIYRDELKALSKKFEAMQ